MVYRRAGFLRFNAYDRGRVKMVAVLIERETRLASTHLFQRAKQGLTLQG